MNDLTGKVALITGGTSGIGEASAIRFAKAGAAVIVAGRNEKRGKEIMTSICESGGRATFCALDVTSDESLAAAAEHVKQHHAKLDILFNNAGIYPISLPLGELERGNSLKLLDINVMGTVMTIQTFLPMLCQSHGVILNNASIAGLERFTQGQSYMYSGSKAAIIKMTELIAKKYGKEIRANVICPGVIRTPIYHTFDEEKHRQNVPAGRVGEAEDVAAAANFLVSDDAAFINGAVITVDGGQSL